jgi:hypothetical protein
MVINTARKTIKFNIRHQAIEAASVALKYPHHTSFNVIHKQVRMRYSSINISLL